METIQFIQITPEQLQNEILKGVRAELQELTKNLQPKEPSELLTRREAASMLKVDLSTIHNWTKIGKLKAYMMVGRVYYKRDEINNALIEL